MDDKKRETPKEKNEEIPDYDDGRTVFYYSRERRLARASPAVQELNEAIPQPRRGLFRTLTATKSMTFTFVSMITLCVVMVLYSLFMTSGGGVKKIHDLNIKLQALKSGDDQSYITLTKTIAGENPYAGEVGMAVSPSGEEKTAIYTEKIYFTPENEEFFNFSVPFTAKTLLVLMAFDEERFLIKLNTR